MIVYRDLMHDEEMISDSLITREEDFFFVAKGSMVVADGDEDDPDAPKVIDIVFRSNLEQVKFTKKTYVSNLKKTLKVITKAMKKTKTEEEVAAWQEKIAAWMNEFLESFDDYDFYMGPSSDIETGLVVLVKWEGADPWFYYWKDALAGSKV